MFLRELALPAVRVEARRFAMPTNLRQRTDVSALTLATPHAVL